MHAEYPNSIADLKLILCGKFLDNGEVLNGAFLFIVFEISNALPVTLVQNGGS
jgi:hypothetical protein